MLNKPINFRIQCFLISEAIIAFFCAKLAFKICNALNTETLNTKEIKKGNFLSLIDYEKLKGAFSFHNDYIKFDENKENNELVIIGMLQVA